MPQMKFRSRVTGLRVARGQSHAEDGEERHLTQKRQSAKAPKKRLGNGAACRFAPAAGKERQ